MSSFHHSQIKKKKQEGNLDGLHSPEFQFPTSWAIRKATFAMIYPF